MNVTFQMNSNYLNSIKFNAILLIALICPNFDSK